MDGHSQPARKCHHLVLLAPSPPLGNPVIIAARALESDHEDWVDSPHRIPKHLDDCGVWVGERRNFPRESSISEEQTNDDSLVLREFVRPGWFRKPTNRRETISRSEVPERLPPAPGVHQVVVRQAKGLPPAWEQRAGVGGSTEHRFLFSCHRLAFLVEGNNRSVEGFNCLPIPITSENLCSLAHTLPHAALPRHDDDLVPD